MAEEAEGLGEVVDPELGKDDDGKDDGLSDLERDQMTHGWRPKDQWKGDSDDWVNAKRFKEKGDMLSEMGRLKSDIGETKKDFGDRLKNATMFINMQNNVLRQELEKTKDQLIKLGDVDGVKDIDKQLKAIPDEEKAGDTKKADNLKLLDWKEKNDWVFDESSEKFKFADNHFKIASTKGMSMKESLKYVDEKVADKYPDKVSQVNQRRNEPGLGETGGKSGGTGKGGGAVPRGSWTFEERLIADSLEGKFTPKEIDQMVADSRRAQV